MEDKEVIEEVVKPKKIKEVCSVCKGSKLSTETKFVRSYYHTKKEVTLAVQCPKCAVK